MLEGYVTTSGRPRMLHRPNRRYANGAIFTGCGQTFKQPSRLAEDAAPALPTCARCERRYVREREHLERLQRRNEDHWNAVIGPNGETRDEVVAAASMAHYLAWLDSRL